MQLVHHAYSNRPHRFYVDSRRVTKDRFDDIKLQARIAQRQLSCLLTRRRRARSGLTHYVHYASIN